MAKRALYLLLIAALVIVMLCACSANEKPVTAAELLSFGEKHLLDMEYEQAIVQFSKLIEIEPKNPQGYIGLAEAYASLGDVAAAADVLEQGLAELPGNAEISELLEKYWGLLGQAAHAMPGIKFIAKRFTAVFGETLEIPFEYIGIAPVSLAVSVRDQGFNSISGFTADTLSQTIIVPNTINAGIYRVTVTAKSGSGENATTFTLEVPAPPMPPVLTFGEASFIVQQGLVFRAPYTLASAEPATITIDAKDSSGASVAGFSVNTAAKIVRGPDILAAGVYTVTVTAKNSIGEVSTGFTLEVPAPPLIAFSRKSFTAKQGTDFQTAYTLSGTEPITVAVAAKNSAGASVSGFTVDTSAKVVNAPKTLAADIYSVTATAKNSIGESSMAFKLTVEAPRTAPAIADSKHGYNFEMTIDGENLHVPVAAAGSTPITWSLESSGSMAVPRFMSIDSATGALTGNARSSSEGDYSFYIRATNDIGSDRRLCTVTVIAAPQAAPKVTTRIYAGEMTKGTDYSVQFGATGSEPLRWTLEPTSAMTNMATVPAEAVISSTGKLHIKGSIAAGTYRFIVRITNSVGSDFFEFTVTVQEKFISLPPAVIIR